MKRNKLDFEFTKEMLQADYDHFNSTIKIAKKYDVSKKTILNYMKKFNIQRSIRIVPIDQVRYLAKKGLTAIEIGKMLGFTNTAISTVGRKYNIKIVDKAHPGFINNNGYILIRTPDHPHCDSKGYVRLHRLIMEKHIGRFLNENELVHHIDKNPANNDINNLKIISPSDHTILHHTGKIGRGPDKKPRKQRGPDKKPRKPRGPDKKPRKPRKKVARS